MESFNSLPKPQTQEQLDKLDIARATFMQKAAKIAEVHQVEVLYVLHIYTLAMGKQIDRNLNDKAVIEAIFSNEILEEVYWDLVEETLKREDVEKLASIDALTELHNRGALDQELKDQVNKFERHPDPISFILIDLDHFKGLNDTFGHTVGDKVLKAVARAIDMSTRRGTDFTARYGGEEIAIVTEGDITAATSLAERVRVAIEAIDVESLGIDENIRQNVTASIGVAQFRATKKNKTETIDELIKRTDIALYEAKHYGRNRVQVSMD